VIVPSARTAHSAGIFRQISGAHRKSSLSGGNYRYLARDKLISRQIRRARRKSSLSPATSSLSTGNERYLARYKLIPCQIGGASRDSSLSRAMSGLSARKSAVPGLKQLVSRQIRTPRRRWASSSASLTDLIADRGSQSSPFRIRRHAACFSSSTHNSAPVCGWKP
jgi:hypothetical protein